MMPGMSATEDLTQFQRVLDAAPDAMVVIDRDGLIAFVNTQTERAFGYPREEMVGRAVEMLLPERHRAAHERDRADYVANPVTRLMGANREVSGRRQDGSELTLEVNLSPIEMDQGLLVLAAIRNVSSRKRLEADRARLAAIFDSTDDAIISITQDGVITTWNHGAEQLFGYSAQEAVGQPDTMLMPAEFHDEYYRLLERLRSGDRIRHYETIRRKKDGTDVHVALTMSPFHDVVRNTTGFSTVLRDITERKRVEEQFRLALETSPNAMIMMNAERKITLVNSQTEKLFGYTREELLGQPIELLVPRRFRAQHSGYVEGFFAAPRPRATGAGRDLFGLRKDGSEVPVEIGLNPLTTKDSTIVLASIVDITERVGNVRRLRALNDDLTQKNHENEMFVYAVSHDLRSPLVNLQGFSTELDEACRELQSLISQPSVPQEVREPAMAILDQDVTQSVKFILNAVTRLGSIIDSLLRLSRVGRIEYRWQNVDVGAVVRRVVDATSATIAERGAVVTVHDLAPAWSDPSAVEQIFANLIGNALKYLDPTRSGAIEIGTNASSLKDPQGTDDKVIYYVKDNGLGIPENCLDKVFQAFQRLNPTLAPGEGMGLAFVRRVVARHDGRVWVESRLGQGSSFFVTLPSSQTTKPAPSDSSSDAECNS